MSYLLNPRAFNPLYWHIKAALRDHSIRFIFVEGGSSASKTYTIAQALEVDQLEHNYSTMVFRRFHIHLKDSVYSTFKLVANKMGFVPRFWQFQEDLIKGANGARIKFRGLDDAENIKGIENYNVVWNNEWSQFQEVHFGQQRKRLRGRPNQKFICDWNPISSQLWQYNKWIDLDTWIDQPLATEAPTEYNSLDPEFSFVRRNEKGDSIWIKVTYRDNYWIEGHPSGQGGFKDIHILDDFERDRIFHPNLYKVYANGERGVMRTGGEFWQQFNEEKHVKPIKFNPALTVHASVDENVEPYVSITLWQVDINLKIIYQIGEICAKPPFNNAPKAAGLLSDWVHRTGYKDTLFLYGDPTINHRSTVDPNNASFYIKFEEVLKSRGVVVRNRVERSAPEVALSADFINEMYENGYNGWCILIGDSNKYSVDDYILAKQMPDGSMAKIKVKNPATGISYEPIGHLSDTKRYFLTTAFKEMFKNYKTKFGRVKLGGISVISRINKITP